MKSEGICYLVGAGPGDIGLVTLKAKHCIETADVLVYDALSSQELINWAPEACEKIYAGKRALNHAIPQGDLNQLLVDKTKEGKTVVRLKGGDPMIFGRGGEEAAQLAEANVKFEIVPGISSTIAGPCYAGIPVTHRDYCTQLTIFTGHEDPTKGESSIDYKQLSETPGTKVFVMGVARLREITTSLIEAGSSPDELIALTRWATTGKQQTVEGTLGTIADIVEEKKFKSPAVAVIGDVVKERKKINWYETRPLLGKSIVVTRTRPQAGSMSKQLAEMGANVVELPTIRIEHPDDKEGFAELVTTAHEYDWLVFTSPNGVEKFFEAFYATYKDARSIGGVRIAAVGPGTKRKINEYRLAVDLMPEKHVAEELVKAFAAEQSVDNQRMLWVRPADARPVVSDGLTSMGAIVDDCIAYKTVMETEDPTGAVKLFTESGADIVTFASASAAENFKALDLPWPEGCKVASIGPVTSTALAGMGMVPHIEAREHNIPGLVQAIVDSVVEAE